MAFVPDMHVPFHDPASVKSMLRFLKRIQPDTVVWLGDVIDAPQISRFIDPEAARDGSTTLFQDCELAQGLLKRGRDAAGSARHVLLLGNHENRLETFLGSKAPELADYPALSIKALLGLDELNISLFPGAGVRLMPDFVARHGTYISSTGNSMSAKREHLAAGISGISGHTHRLGTYRKGGYVQRTWTEAGCLCQLEPRYIEGIPDWQKGMAVGEFNHQTGSFVVEEVPFVDDRLRWGGKRY